MPDASETDQREATENLRAFVAVLYRVVLRLEAEENRGRRDKNRLPAKVYTQNKKNV